MVSRVHTYDGSTTATTGYGMAWRGIGYGLEEGFENKIKDRKLEEMWTVDQGKE